MESNERLVERIQAGDTSARSDRWERNKTAVSCIALRHYLPLVKQCGAVDLEDLIQAGYIGIYQAVEMYSVSLGIKFSTFLEFPVRKEMQRALGIYTKKRDLCDFAISLDESRNNDGGRDTSVFDRIADTTADERDGDALERQELQNAVRASVARMNNKLSRRAVLAYYFSGLTEVQAAKLEGMTEKALSQRIVRGYHELYNDKTLQQWARDYVLVDPEPFRHKGVNAFKTSRSSAVEDTVILTETVNNKRAALRDALGSLV